MPGFQTAFRTQLTDVDSTAKETLGSVRWVGNKLYKYVKLLNTSDSISVAANDSVAYALGQYANHVVVSDMTDSQATNPVGAGLVQAGLAATAGTAYYLWIQTQGPASPLKNFGGAPNDGDALNQSQTDKTMIVRLVNLQPRIFMVDKDTENKGACVFPI